MGSKRVLRSFHRQRPVTPLSDDHPTSAITGRRVPAVPRKTEANTLSRGHHQDVHQGQDRTLSCSTQQRQRRRTPPSMDCRPADICPISTEPSSYPTNFSDHHSRFLRRAREVSSPTTRTSRISRRSQQHVLLMGCSSRTVVKLVMLSALVLGMTAGNTYNVI
jgi:hypothetical protein